MGQSQNTIIAHFTLNYLFIIKYAVPLFEFSVGDLKEWQGPAIYFYNNAKFKDSDFKNLARIGQASKLNDVSTTGRFGLGFNAVYHFSDVPSFVTGDHFVAFDPHTTFFPDASINQPGVKIKFRGVCKCS